MENKKVQAAKKVQGHSKYQTMRNRRKKPKLIRQEGGRRLKRKYLNQVKLFAYTDPIPQDEFTVRRYFNVNKERFCKVRTRLQVIMDLSPDVLFEHKEIVPHSDFEIPVTYAKIYDTLYDKLSGSDSDQYDVLYGDDKTKKSDTEHTVDNASPNLLGDEEEVSEQLGEEEQMEDLSMLGREEGEWEDMEMDQEHYEMEYSIVEEIEEHIIEEQENDDIQSQLSFHVEEPKVIKPIFNRVSNITQIDDEPLVTVSHLKCPIEKISSMWGRFTFLSTYEAYVKNEKQSFKAETKGHKVSKKFKKQMDKMEEELKPKTDEIDVENEFENANMEEIMQLGRHKPPPSNEKPILEADIVTDLEYVENEDDFLICEVSSGGEINVDSGEADELDTTTSEDVDVSDIVEDQYQEEKEKEKKQKQKKTGSVEEEDIDGYDLLPNDFFDQDEYNVPLEDQQYYGEESKIPQEKEEQQEDYGQKKKHQRKTVPLRRLTISQKEQLMNHFLNPYEYEVVKIRNNEDRDIDLDGPDSDDDSRDDGEYLLEVYGIPPSDAEDGSEQDKEVHSSHCSLVEGESSMSSNSYQYTSTDESEADDEEEGEESEKDLSDEKCKASDESEDSKEEIAEESESVEELFDSEDDEHLNDEKSQEEDKESEGSIEGEEESLDSDDDDDDNEIEEKEDDDKFNVGTLFHKRPNRKKVVVNPNLCHLENILNDHQQVKRIKDQGGVLIDDLYTKPGGKKKEIIETLQDIKTVQMRNRNKLKQMRSLRKLEIERARADKDTDDEQQGGEEVKENNELYEKKNIPKLRKVTVLTEPIIEKKTKYYETYFDELTLITFLSRILYQEMHCATVDEYLNFNDYGDKERSMFPLIKVPYFSSKRFKVTHVTWVYHMKKSLAISFESYEKLSTSKFCEGYIVIYQPFSCPEDRDLAFGFKSGVRHFDFAHEYDYNMFMLVGLECGSIQMLKLPFPTVIRETTAETKHNKAVVQVVWMSDWVFSLNGKRDEEGRPLDVKHQRFASSSEDGVFKFWYVVRYVGFVVYKTVHLHQVTVPNTHFQTRYVGISAMGSDYHDRSMYYLGTTDGKIYKFSGEDSAQSFRFVVNAHRGPVLDIAVNYYNRDVILSGGSDGVVKLWRGNGSKPVWTYFMENPIVSIAWSHQQSYVWAVATKDSQVRVFNLERQFHQAMTTQTVLRLSVCAKVEFHHTLSILLVADDESEVTLLKLSRMAVEPEEVEKEMTFTDKPELVGEEPDPFLIQRERLKKAIDRNEIILRSVTPVNIHGNFEKRLFACKS